MHLPSPPPTPPQFRNQTRSKFQFQTYGILFFTGVHKLYGPEIPGFQFVHKNRIAGEGGGVAMYLSDDLKWKRRTDLET